MAGNDIEQLKQQRQTAPRRRSGNALRPMASSNLLRLLRTV
jgi:hypothetical protein